MKVQHRRDDGALPPHLTDDARLAQLADWGARLTAAGLSPATSGNLSCRTTDGFLITRTGVPMAAITIEDWVHVTAVGPHDKAGILVTSHGLHEPSKDSAVHAAIYANRPGATTVFHFHVGHLDVLTGRLDIPTTATYYPAGTTESMKEIQRFLGQHPGIDYFVLVDHGIVAVGSSIASTGDLVQSHHQAVAALESS